MTENERVVTRLRDALLRGEYAPRERLVEFDLAEQLGTSRFIARKALVQLASEGLVEIQPNRGARVRELSVEDAIGVTEVRGAVESLVARRAAENATDDDIARLREIATAMEEAVRAFEVVRYTEVNHQLHAALREMAGHEAAAALLLRLNGQVVQHQFVLPLMPGRPAAALAEHLAIIEAVATRDPDAAEQAMRAHIRSVIAALRTFGDGGAATHSGIRELARNIKPTATRQSGVLTPVATLRYAEESERQVIDLYLPDSSHPGPHPLVLIIHGGAFMMGDRTWDLEAVPALLHAGFAVASVEYRLSAEALFPAAVLDVKKASAHLRSAASRWNLDSSFVAAWGRSAGGYLASMLGATNDQDSAFDTPGCDSTTSAVISWGGVVDFGVMDAQFAEHPPTGDGPPVQSHGGVDSPESKFLGSAVEAVPDLVQRASVLTYAHGTKKLPPFFLAAGTNDRLVPHQQTMMLADALRSHDVAVEEHIVKDANHSDRAFQTGLADTAIAWLLSVREGAAAAAAQRSRSMA